MNGKTDLNEALSFVVKQIESEATRSGEPLTDEERLLLTDLPTAPSLSVTPSSSPEFPTPMPVPRDLAYERLIALAKQARQYDIRLDSVSDRKWRYVATVCKLHRHPMLWLLRWSGIKEDKSWWDRVLLIVCALVLTLCFLALMLLGIIEDWTRLGWTITGIGYFAISFMVYFASRHVEERRLRREIEKYHRAAGPTGQLL